MVDASLDPLALAPPEPAPRVAPRPGICVLGAVEVTDPAGVPVRLRGRLAHLLGVLVEAAPRGVQRSDLADMLWDGGVRGDPGGALDPLLSRLRRLVGPIDGRGEVRLGASPESDVSLARAELAAARAAWPADPATAFARAREAARWLEAEFLPGVDEPWVAERRRRFELDRDSARSLVAEAALELGGDALQHGSEAAAALVAADPLDEHGYELLMRCQLAAGREGSAMGTYSRARDELHAAHGGSPGRALDALLERARRAQHTATQAHATRLPLALARERRTPLVGRTSELAALLAACGPGGSDGLIVLHGPSGIGKTRLLAEVAAEVVAAGALVLHGRALETEPLPFGALAQALRPVAGDALQWAAGADLDEQRSEPAPPGVRRYRAFDRVAAALRQSIGRAGGGHLLLTIDDAQWLDRSSVHLLDHLLRDGAVPGLRVIAASRVAEVAAPLRRAAGRSGVTVPLAGPSPLLRRSAEELGRAIHDTADLQLATAAALGRADLAVRQVVQLVAVGGDQVEARVIAAVLGCHVSDVQAMAAAARTHGVLEEAIDQHQVGRLHDARRQAVLSSIDPSAERSAHRAIAGVLESLIDDPGFHGGDLDAADPATPRVDAQGWLRDYGARLADHWRRAGGIIALRRAGRYGARAAEVALDGLAFEQAAALAGQARIDLRGPAIPGGAADAIDDGAALVHDPSDPRLGDELPGAPRRSEELSLLLLEGRALNAAGALAAARPVWTQAIALARVAGTADEEATAALGLAGPRIGGALRDPDLRVALEHSLQRPPSDPALGARLRSRLAGELAEGPVEVRRDLATEAIELARGAGCDAALAEALLWRQLVMLCDAEDGREALTDEAERVARGAGRLDLALHARLLRFSDLVEAGDLDGAEGELVAWEREANAAILPYNRWVAAVSAPTIALAHGRFDEASELIARATALAAPLGDDWMVTSAVTGQLMSLALAVGDVDVVRGALGPVIDGGAALPVWEAALAYTHLVAGDDDQALELLARAVRHGAASSVDALRITTASFLAVVAAIAGGRRDTLEALHRALAPHADRWVTQHYGSATHGPVAYRLALLEIALGDIDAAQRRIASVAPAARGIDLPAIAAMERAHATARLHAARGQHEQAAEVAGAAVAHAEALGAHGWVHLLRRIA
jgi:DNA-binding SARP family transcriptional activator/tetratricopeptide (TPR) repeat protein